MELRGLIIHHRISAPGGGDLRKEAEAALPVVAIDLLLLLLLSVIGFGWENERYINRNNPQHGPGLYQDPISPPPPPPPILQATREVVSFKGGFFFRFNPLLFLFTA